MTLVFSEKLSRLPLQVREYFVSNDARLDLEKSFFAYGVSESQIRNVAKQIGLIFINDFSLGDLPREIGRQCNVSPEIAYGVASEISKKMFVRFSWHFLDANTLSLDWEKKKADPLVSNSEVQKKLLQVEPWILETQKEENQKAIHKLDIQEITLLKALEKYPRIHEQQITADRIRVRSEKDPVRGTVRQWMRAYRDAVGVRKHTAIERGQFLFQSENAKRLPQTERERVSVLLKALDENETLSVDTQRQEIVFPKEPSFKTTPLPPKEAPPAFGTLPSWRSVKPLQTAPPVAPSAKTFHLSSGGPSLRQHVTAPLPTFIQKEPKKSVSSEEPEAPFRFSSGHILPSEKTTAENKPGSQLENEAPLPKKTFEKQIPDASRSSAFGLGYVGAFPTNDLSGTNEKRKEVWEIPDGLRNVVDLRSEDEEN